MKFMTSIDLPGRGRWLARAALASLTLATGGVGAFTLSDPGLQATVFSSQPSVSVVLPGSASVGFDGYLYVMARGEPPRINLLVKFDAAGNELARTELPIDAAMPSVGSGAYAGRMFLNEFALPNDATDGVYELNPDGSVMLFSALGGGNPDTHGITFGDGGSFGDAIYASNPTSGSSDARANTAIVMLDDVGGIVKSLIQDPDGPYYIALTPAGSKADYGDYIYYTLLNSNRVMRVDAAGNASTFVTLEPDDRGFDLDFGIGGTFGNALYLLLYNPNSVDSRRFVRVHRDGTMETLGTGLGGFRLAFDPDSKDLFIANEGGGVLRIAARDCTGKEAGELAFSGSTQSFMENAGVVEIVVTRACGTTGEVTVDYMLTPGSAVPAVDYRHPEGAGTPQTDTGQLIFADGVAELSIFVEMVDNDVLDGTRNFVIELLVPTGGAELSDPALVAVSVLDDDTGADLSVENVSFNKLESSDMPTFEGLTSGFNDLRYRYQVVARIRNNGPTAISNFSFELDVPKEQLAGYGQAPGSTCSVVTFDPIDPDYVHIACSGLSLEPGESMDLPTGDAGFYVGYASIGSRELRNRREKGFTYHARVNSGNASVPDPDASNDSRSETVVPPNGKSKSGGGSSSPEWLLLFGLLAMRRFRGIRALRRRMPGVGGESAATLNRS